MPGAGEHSIPVKPIAEFNDRWLALRERIRASPAPLRVVVVGGGAGGVEMALAMRAALDKQQQQARLWGGSMHRCSLSCTPHLSGTSRL